MFLNQLHKPLFSPVFLLFQEIAPLFMQLLPLGIQKSSLLLPSLAFITGVILNSSCANSLIVHVSSHNLHCCHTLALYSKISQLDYCHSLQLVSRCHLFSFSSYSDYSKIFALLTIFRRFCIALKQSSNS